ncbi:hypothetical protein AAG906_022068 [Vitis piasezkii]
MLSKFFQRVWGSVGSYWKKKWLDAQECFGDSHFKSWPRNITLPIIVKIKDQQHQWKKLKLPQR